MFDTKYRIDKIKEFSAHDARHDYIVGKICYPAYFVVGEHGMLIIEKEYVDRGCNVILFAERYMNYYTSKIKSVVVNRDNSFIVTTDNAEYTFTAVMVERALDKTKL